MCVFLISPNLNILKEYEIAVIEDITLLAVEAPLRAIVLNIVPPEVSSELLVVKLISSQALQRDISIATGGKVDLDNCLFEESKTIFK